MNSRKTLLFIPLAVFLLNFLFEKKADHYTDPRDGNTYNIIQLDNLNWFKENLRYRSTSKKDTLISLEKCGVFYFFEDAKSACPNGWRLPTEKEVKSLIQADKKGKINLIDTLEIQLCGRIDYDTHAKAGSQNTFWLNEELSEGHISHWHTFSTENKIHSHNVINARRKFPVRCVCEIK